ncbi:MAG: DegT/DnrJ/EryC1/StrS family aminotransferase [Verrucomicrobiota bacterium]|nr:DegT/DnrJ/EryC1/StrS family aminotransferase [Verrucomicrobiota bacterium]
MEVPFFCYPHVFAQYREEALAALLKAADRGAYILQDEVREFEDAVQRFTGARHVVGVANGTDGLALALRAAGVGAGDEVIMASHTYVATAAAVHFNRATPILVECGEDHLIDVVSAAAVITPRTRAIVPTQLNGRTCDMAALMALAEARGLIVIEDAAQALGSKFRGQCAGTFGLAGMISLYPAKLLGCLGDGGLVMTNDDAMAEKLRLLRDHGRNEEGEVVAWGVNSRLDTVQAAVLLAKFKHYPGEIERRRAIARRYRDRLAGLDDLKLPPGPDDGGHFDVYQNYEVEAGCRDALRAHLSEHGVGTIIQWGGKPVHKLSGLGFEDISLPRTEAIFERCFLLPMNTSLTDEEVDYICDMIRKFYGKD